MSSLQLPLIVFLTHSPVEQPPRAGIGHTSISYQTDLLVLVQQMLFEAQAQSTCGKTTKAHPLAR